MAEQAAYGTKMAIWDPTANAGAGAYVTIADVLDISGPSLARDALDVTSHDATEGWRDFIYGLKDAGEVTFDVLFDPTEPTHKNAQGGLLFELAQGTAAQQFQITWPDGTTTWTFNGLVTGFEPGAPVEDKLTASVTIKISGKPTLT